MPKETQQADDPRESDLAQAACAGDQQAFAELFNTLYPRVQRTVLGMLGDEQEAHDVSQEAWIKAWKRRATFNFASSYSTWVHRIAINTALDTLRQRKRRRTRIWSRLVEPLRNRSVIEPEDTRAKPPEELENRELGKRIEQAIAALPDEQRTVLVLREYEDYSYAEIAELVGCSPGTVMSRLHLARRKLQDRLGRELP